MVGVHTDSLASGEAAQHVRISTAVASSGYGSVAPANLRALSEARPSANGRDLLLKPMDPVIVEVDSHCLGTRRRSPLVGGYRVHAGCHGVWRYERVGDCGCASFGIAGRGIV